jgi:hypothetical protein
MGVLVGPGASERYGEETVLTLVGNGTSDRPASSLVTFVDCAGRSAAFSFRCFPKMKASVEDVYPFSTRRRVNGDCLSYSVQTKGGRHDFFSFYNTRTLF